jgi:hypothetical protein
LLIAAPDQCGDCPLNPRNKPAPSPRLSYLYRVQNWQAAGAAFHFTDLRPADWDDLVTLKTEQNRWGKEQWRKK